MASVFNHQINGGEAPALQPPVAGEVAGEDHLPTAETESKEKQEPKKEPKKKAAKKAKENADS